MSDTFKKIAIFSIVLGIIMLSINMLFGNTISFLEQVTINNVRYYVINFRTYKDNIITTFTDTSMLQLEGISRTWNNDIINNLAYMLDVIILVINLFTYPVRVAMFTAKTLLSILGINFQDPKGLKWLVDAIDFMIKLHIQYV